MSLCELHKDHNGLISQNTHLETDTLSLQEPTTDLAFETVPKGIAVVICSKFALLWTLPPVLKQLRHQKQKA